MSEKYIVSARKYRPATFKTVIGQPGLVSTLRNAVHTGRVAQAYLFCGPRGVGKTSCARIFAKAVNCLNPGEDGEACGVCESCRSIDQGNSFNLVELDAASNNSVDDIRTITEQVTIAPQIGKYRVFIIDEVHMLSSQAFNAFLKTLEEPPSYAIFILATTEKHKVIPTILSRCQIYDFKRITINDIIDQLKYVAEAEGIKADTKALGVIARKADGAMRDALSIFDQVAASCGGNLTYANVTDNLNVLDYDYFFRLIDDFKRGDVADSLLVYKDVRDRGFDSQFFINNVAQHVRDLMVAADKRTLPLLETPDDISAQLSEQAGTLPLPWYYRAIELLNECDVQYRTSGNKQLLVELTLIRLCQLLNPLPAPFDKAPGKQPMRDPSRGPHTDKALGERGEQKNDSLQGVQSPGERAPAGQPEPGLRTSGRKTARQKTIRLVADSEEQYNEKNRTTEYSAEEFENAWKEAGQTFSEYTILSTAMQQGIPEAADAEKHEYVVTVRNQAQQQWMENLLQKITDFMRNRLKNDSITMRVALDTKGESAPRHLPPHEFLKEAISKNPELGAFLKEMDAIIV